jgi:hypothetical protein
MSQRCPCPNHSTVFVKEWFADYGEQTLPQLPCSHLRVWVRPPYFWATEHRKDDGVSLTRLCYHVRCKHACLYTCLHTVYKMYIYHTYEYCVCMHIWWYVWCTCVCNYLHLNRGGERERLPLKKLPCSVRTTHQGTLSSPWLLAVVPNWQLARKWTSEVWQSACQASVTPSVQNPSTNKKKGKRKWTSALQLSSQQPEGNWK